MAGLGTVRTIGLDAVNAKLALAAPRILANNRAMVTAMLAEIKPIVEAETPIGPGHFGYHLRDSFTTDVSSKGVVTTGVLKSPPTGYWREYGTLGRFRKSRAVRSYVAALGGFGTGGEKAYQTAHHAASGIQRFIKFYYGSMANWWRA